MGCMGVAVARYECYCVVFLDGFEENIKSSLTKNVTVKCKVNFEGCV
jgi:hypothetical protein